MDPISITALRRDLFRLVDKVLDTGLPLTIQKGGKRLVLTAESPAPVPGKLARLRKRPILAGKGGTLRDLVNVQAGRWRELDR